MGNQKKASGPVPPGQQLQLPGMLPGRFVEDRSNEPSMYGRTNAVHFNLPRAERGRRPKWECLFQPPAFNVSHQHIASVQIHSKTSSSSAH